MNLSPYLGFDSNCREAFEFYAKLFGGKIEMMVTAADTPMAAQMPASRQRAIMHARLSIGPVVLMGGDMAPADDAGPGCDAYRKPTGFSLSWQVDSIAEAERIYAGLAEGGEVRMPIGETFWAKRFGMVTDRFGIPWQVNCEREA